MVSTRGDRDMLRAMKLSPWEVWRYSEYVGLTPKERLAISSDAELQKHYEAVAPRGQRESAMIRRS